MKRIFGTKKEKPPTPTIDEASGRLTTRGDTYAYTRTLSMTILFPNSWVSSSVLDSANGRLDAFDVRVGLMTRSGSSMSS